MDVLDPYIKKGDLKVIYEKDDVLKTIDSNNASENYRDELFNEITIERGGKYTPKDRMAALLDSIDRENSNREDKDKVKLDAVLVPNDAIKSRINDALENNPDYKNKTKPYITDINKLPCVTGQNADFPSAFSIAHDEQYMTVFKDTNRMAEAAIIMADEILTGAEPVLVPDSVEIYDSGHLKDLADVTLGNHDDKMYVHAFLLDPVPITTWEKLYIAIRLVR